MVSMVGIELDGKRAALLEALNVEVPMRHGKLACVGIER
jgi:hypothetical protein